MVRVSPRPIIADKDEYPSFDCTTFSLSLRRTSRLLRHNLLDCLWNFLSKYNRLPPRRIFTEKPGFPGKSWQFPLAFCSLYSLAIIAKLSGQIRLQCAQSRTRCNKKLILGEYRRGIRNPSAPLSRLNTMSILISSNWRLSRGPGWFVAFPGSQGANILSILQQ